MNLTKDTLVSELMHTEDELTHYGILGMKWGVRRYQNKDGSLTAKGKKRYGDSDYDDDVYVWSDAEGWVAPRSKSNVDDLLAESIGNTWGDRGEAYVKSMPLLDYEFGKLDSFPSKMPSFNLSDYEDWD